ncbi:NAD-dependent epimerase/dehydratase family protein [uncultured Treponema sp.]|uniref:NAD-dependent epimerase/dehydratase family protein n=1 Tax=uncultured Treponema sp. TaxID=162155 RepID=UPI00262503D4|nr:NAD-dependent epimerase/dehydratase family protein [uncultured Treponema sp.]
MRILILGGTGFLGRNSYSVLKKDNYVIATNIRLTSYIDIIELIKNQNIEIVMHFVSTLIPNSSKEDFFYDLNNVYIPTVHILEYCALNSIRFVYISSGGAIYGNHQTLFSEQTKKEPISYYGLSKLNMENLINYYHNSKSLQYITIRPSNPYGPGQNIYGKQGLIAVLIGKIIEKKTIEIWGDGSAIKDFIYIDDFTEYLSILIGNISFWNNTYNIGSGIGNSVIEILNAFAENDILLPKIEYKQEKASDVKHMILDCTKVKHIINKKCLSIKEGIKKFYEYEMEKIK